MGEGGDASDTDSDETLIEDSVAETESDLEEEELRGKRLPLIVKDTVHKTENNHATGIKIINGDSTLSPEIQRICKHNILRRSEPINLAYQEKNEKEKESQSLLYLFVTGNLYLEKVDGDFLKWLYLHNCIIETCKGLNDECSPEISLLPGSHAMVELSKDSVTKCTEISEAFQRVKMTSNKENATESGLSLETAASRITKSRKMVEKFEVQDLMEPLYDSKNSQISPVLLEYQDNALCVTESLDESNGLPEELLTAINSFSESVVPPICQLVGKEGGQTMAEKQPTPESIDDDCTQITDANFESQFHVRHLKETEPLKQIKSSFPSEKQLDCNQDIQKLVILDQQTVPSYNRPAGKENSTLEEISSCKPTIQATSYALQKSDRKKRELPCSDVNAASKCQRFLKQKIQNDQAQTRSSEYDDVYMLAQEFNTKGQADQCSQLGIDLASDMNTKVEQVRRSQRIARRNGKQTTSKIYSRDSSFSCISLSRINRRDIFGQTLLHKAAMEDDLDCVRAVIRAGAKVNAQDYAGWTPLHEASVAGSFEITQELLKAGADVNCKGSEQITPLHDAVIEGHYKVAKLLLWYGADPLLKEEKGKSAIEEATDNRMRTLLESYVDKYNRRTRSAKRLVEDPVIEQNKIEKSQSQPKVDSLGDNLRTAKKTELVCTVREEGINPVNEQNREQYVYSENPRYQVNLDCDTETKMQIKIPPKPLESVMNKQFNSTLLRNFTPHMHEDLMMGPRASGNNGKYCFERTENGRLENKTILDLPVLDKVPFQDGAPQTEMNGKCSSELNGKANLNSKLDVQFDEFKTAQSKRMQNNFNENCQNAHLLSCDNAKNVSSETHQTKKQRITAAQDSSHYSKMEKTTSSSQQLPSVVDRIYKRNTKGETCLHMAAKKGDLSLVKSLVASGACVNQKDNAGWTPIHEASNGGYTEVIAELLKSGADVNCKGLDGVLPIHNAVSGNHFEVVRLLLHHGANVNETDNCGKNAMDEATCDKMIELLKSYGATETKKTSRMSDVAVKGPLTKATAILVMVDWAKEGHESLSKILQDIEKKQVRLLLLELKNQRDADHYIRDLSQIQNLLNGVLAKQKSERDDLTKKYRASAESFKQGILREQLVKLVSRQKSLLLMAQKQKELGQKILNYNNAKKDPSCSAKRMFNSCARNNTKNSTSGKTEYPDVVMDLETSSALTNSSLDQEISQFPNRSLNVSGSNGDAIKHKKVGLHNLVPENRLEADTIAEELNSKISDSKDQATLLSEPVVCFIQTAQPEEIDYISVTPPGNKHPPATPRSSILSISASGNVGVAVNQPTNEDQHVCSNESLQQHSNINKEPTLELESTHSYLATHQKDIFLKNKIALDNPEPTGMFSHALSPSRFSQNPSQSFDNRDSKEKSKTNRIKRPQLLDLLVQGKIKPGDDVLEFTLQDSKHKASLLRNGKVKTSNSVYQNPVQWIKALLSTSVSWKYVWNKVTYCGIQLSTITAEVEESFKKSELPLQQNIFGRNSAEQDRSYVAECSYSSQKATSLQEVCNIEQEVIPSCQEEVRFLSSLEIEAEEPSLLVRENTKYSTFEGSVISGTTKSSHQPNSSKTLKSLLQFNEIVLREDEEFMPCHIMDQYWNFYVHCEKFGF
ncbi:ankyrin repeat domain-containing protein 31 [Tiliqua scincoides]|uniref:ankyrin repeat domain-containing protein 31 n=1 Tax=Tiliqua scincoides TaxID=71010 RepID=UPI003461FA62